MRPNLKNRTKKELMEDVEVLSLDVIRLRRLYKEQEIELLKSNALLEYWRKET